MIIACLVNGSKEGLFPGSLFSCFLVAWTLGTSTKKWHAKRLVGLEIGIFSRSSLPSVYCHCLVTATL